MRPLKLEVYGLTCYRDPQPTLDFEGMSLFAISGPTGAGKSTILDGILYALFGMVPRIGKQGLIEFISHGRDVLSVRLDFNLRGNTYRITRRAKRGKNDQLQTVAALAELQSAGEKSIADTVTTVDAAVTDLLGLDFDAFTQTVILPQNQFARFLQSKPKEQRQILQRLLRHTIYDRMRAEAERRKGLLERDRQGKDEQLAQLKGATAEALDALGVQLVEAKERKAGAHTQRAAAAAALQEGRVRRQLTVDLEKVRELLADLSRRTPSIERGRDELVQARRAIAVTPQLDLLRLATERSEKAARAVTDASKRVNDMKVSAEKSRASLDAAEQAAVNLESIRQTLNRLHEIRLDVERKPGLSHEMEELRARLVDADRAVAEARSSVDAAQAKAAKAAERLEQLRTDSAVGAYDTALHARLDALRSDATRAVTMGEELEELVKTRENLNRQLNTAKNKALTSSKAHQNAATAYEDAEVARRAAEQERLLGAQRTSAATIRQELVKGKPCPVCEHVVTRVPSRTGLPKLERLEAAVDRAVEKEKSARQALQRAGRELEREEAKVDELSETATKLKADLASREEKCRVLKTRLTKALGRLFPVTDANVLSVFDRALADLQRIGANHEKRRTAIASAEKLVHEVDLALVRAQTAYRHEEQTKEQLARELERLSAEFTAMSARITAVTSAKDPAAELASLTKRVETLEKNLSDTREKAKLEGEQLVAANAMLQASQETAASADSELVSSRASLEKALAAQGFESVAAALKAVRAADRIRVLDKEIRDFDQAQTSARDRFEELEPKILGREIDSAAIERLERDSVAAERALEAAVGAASRIEEQVETLKTNVERAGRLSAERATVLRTLGTTSEMASDLRNDSFQEYLLEEAFKGLVVGASARLREMSGRYTMEWRAGEFYVLDHDNAGDRRRAETLSGGETFIASLCLALQLSDEVLQASGAIRMDSLFIDEGFGSLDAQSLFEVTNALENLRQGTDRVVGIISHLPDLTARLPGCIRVEKGLGESRWVVERVG